MTSLSICICMYTCVCVCYRDMVSLSMCVFLCYRNLSSAGEEARKQMRCCEGLVDSLLYIIKACVNTSDFDSKVSTSHSPLSSLSFQLL